MRVFTNKEGEYTEAGEVIWSDGSFDVTTDNEDIERVVERVNNTQTWDTAKPREHKNAPVAERDAPVKENRARSLLRTYLLSDGFGLLNENEQLQPDSPF